VSCPIDDISQVMPSNRRIWIAAAAAIVVIALAFALTIGWQRRQLAKSERAQRARFVGAAACARCHAAEYTSWSSSQHAVAMQDARQGSVKGRFDGERFSAGEVTSTFFQRGNRYFANTRGEDGLPHDYEVRWTFGVYPLQQYLVDVSGRVQALTVAWDARPRAMGGQRWFSLTPGHGAAPEDELRWTGPLYNWNSNCADCHSTAVRKGYDERSNRFQTSFAEISVGCEACHGPGSRHAAWGRYPALLRRLVWNDDGLRSRLDERRGVQWAIDSSTGIPSRSTPRRTDREIETCAQCHAARAHIAEGYEAGARFLDYYIPLLIAESYYPDGQQRDEVYNYGSFLQSRMYSAGVTCSDCHEPHSGRLRKPGNQLCTQCHLAAKYDSATHHRHPAGSSGSSCASCHMPAKTYMGIDPRPDHSIRIPRPDLTLSLGVPNPCNACHTNRDAGWAAAQISNWYPNPRPGFQRFAAAFAADDRNASGTTDSLVRVANDSSEPWFVRASAIGRLAGHPGAVTLNSAQRWAGDPRPLVRLGALQVAESFDAADRLVLGVPMLTDSTRAIRQGAAWILAPLVDSLRGPNQRRAFDAAAAEFIASQRYNADRASNHLVLGLFFAQRGEADSAAAEFRAALRIDPRMVQAEAALTAIQRARGAGGLSPGEGKR
jgi:predicted CXXCH cytochrome family protein